MLNIFKKKKEDPVESFMEEQILVNEEVTALLKIYKKNFDSITNNVKIVSEIVIKQRDEINNLKESIEQLQELLNKEEES